MKTQEETTFCDGIPFVASSTFLPTSSEPSQPTSTSAENCCVELFLPVTTQAESCSPTTSTLNKTQHTIHELELCLNEGLSDGISGIVEWLTQPRNHEALCLIPVAVISAGGNLTDLSTEIQELRRTLSQSPVVDAIVFSTAHTMTQLLSEIATSLHLDSFSGHNLCDLDTEYSRRFDNTTSPQPTPPDTSTTQQLPTSPHTHHTLVIIQNNISELTSAQGILEPLAKQYERLMLQREMYYIRNGQTDTPTSSGLPSLVLVLGASMPLPYTFERLCGYSPITDCFIAKYFLLSNSTNILNSIVNGVLKCWSNYTSAATQQIIIGPGTLVQILENYFERDMSISNFVFAARSALLLHASRYSKYFAENIPTPPNTSSSSSSSSSSPFSPLSSPPPLFLPCDDTWRLEESKQSVAQGVFQQWHSLFELVLTLCDAFDISKNTHICWLIYDLLRPRISLTSVDPDFGLDPTQLLGILFTSAIGQPEKSLTVLQQFSTKLNVVACPNLASNLERFISGLNNTLVKIATPHSPNSTSSSFSPDLLSLTSPPSRKRSPQEISTRTFLKAYHKSSAWKVDRVNSPLALPPPSRRNSPSIFRPASSPLPLLHISPIGSCGQLSTPSSSSSPLGSPPSRFMSPIPPTPTATLWQLFRDLFIPLEELIKYDFTNSLCVDYVEELQALLGQSFDDSPYSVSTEIFDRQRSNTEGEGEESECHIELGKSCNNSNPVTTLTPLEQPHLQLQVDLKSLVHKMLQNPLQPIYQADTTPEVANLLLQAELLHHGVFQWAKPKRNQKN